MYIRVLGIRGMPRLKKFYVQSKLASSETEINSDFRVQKRVSHASTPRLPRSWLINTWQYLYALFLSLASLKLTFTVFKAIQKFAFRIIVVLQKQPEIGIHYNIYIYSSEKTVYIKSLCGIFSPVLLTLQINKIYF